MTPIATWLRTTRDRHGLSQESLVAEINAWAQVTGQRNERGDAWQLHRPNYVGWEGGKQATKATVDRLIAFWQSRGEPAPDLTPEPPKPSFEERAVIAAERQAAAAERQASAMEALVAMLGGRVQPDPAAVEAMQAWGQAALARSQSPGPQPAPTPRSER